jgi:peptide/nickel transport system substrate-binding protein
MTLPRHRGTVSRTGPTIAARRYACPLVRSSRCPVRNAVRRSLTALLATALLALGASHAAASQPGPGEVVIAWHVTIAPSWFDPSTAPPQITPFGILYAPHDALVRPLPGQKMAPSLAESWKRVPTG